jgi:hypothetical protein
MASVSGGDEELARKIKPTRVARARRGTERRRVMMGLRSANRLGEKQDRESYYTGMSVVA